LLRDQLAAGSGAAEWIVRDLNRGAGAQHSGYAVVALARMAQARGLPRRAPTDRCHPSP
jgi:hypothetical protein